MEKYIHVSMTLCKTAVTPLLTHWSYCSFALSHQYDVMTYKYDTVASIMTQAVNHNIDGLEQDYCISSALAMEILQSCINHWYDVSKHLLF